MAKNVFGDEIVEPAQDSAQAAPQINMFGDPIVKPSINPVEQKHKFAPELMADAARHAASMPKEKAQAEAIAPESPGFFTEALEGGHKVATGLMNLAENGNPVRPVLDAVSPGSYSDAKNRTADLVKRAGEAVSSVPFLGGVGEGIENLGQDIGRTPEERSAANEETDKAIQTGRGVTPQSPWYKRADVPELIGETVATLPIGELRVGAAGLKGALATGLLQGGTQGTIEGSAEGHPVAGAVGGAAGGTVAHGLLNRAGAALASYLSRNMPESLKNAAVQNILSRFSQDKKSGGVSAQDAIDSVNAAGQLGVPLSLAEAGGPNVRGLAGTLARSPGESKGIASTAMEADDKAQPGRLRQYISNLLNGGPSMFHTTQALLQARSAAAQPAYETAMDPTRVVDSPTIRAIVADPTVRSLMNKGIESQRLEALAAGKPFSHTIPVDDSAGSGTVIGANGNLVRQTQVPNMRLLDAAKRGLDHEIEGERNELTGRLSQRGVMLDRVRQKLVSELDAQNPDYKAARNAWGGPSSSMDAMRFGQTALTRSPDELADEFSRMSDSEKEFARLGLADKLRENIGKTVWNGNEANNILKSQWMKEQVHPFFRSEDEFNKFIDSVKFEQIKSGARNQILKGSQTAERGAEDENPDLSIAQKGASAMTSALSNNWHSAIGRILEMRRMINAKDNPELNSEMARLLFTPGHQTLNVEPLIRNGREVGTYRLPGFGQSRSISSDLSSAATLPLAGGEQQTGLLGALGLPSTTTAGSPAGSEQGRSGNSPQGTIPPPPPGFKVNQ